MTVTMRAASSLLLGAGVLALVAATASGRTAQGVWVQLRDGARVKVADSRTVYVVDRGALRPVTGGAHEALWPSFKGIVEIESVPEGSVGARLDDATRLVKAPDDPAVWLLDRDGSVRRHVSDLHVFGSKWAFSWAKVRSVPLAEIEALPVGDPVE